MKCIINLFDIVEDNNRGRKLIFIVFLLMNVIFKLQQYIKLTVSGIEEDSEIRIDGRLIGQPHTHTFPARTDDNFSQGAGQSRQRKLCIAIDVAAFLSTLTAPHRCSYTSR
ncbi:hypothetical protein CEXT_649311 [Caerostris extrusa]|uniref:Uncharacterized protein n=1 Tax=Caerostris extrusa TaxID=172846 RepID=A0AAV4Y2Q0_CAEEX|nr:hypothetical protein CEXT_649311 [Caerostris extrusa]